MSITLEIPKKIINGIGAFKELPELLENRGFHRISLIVDPYVSSTDYVMDVLEQVRSRGIQIYEYTGIKSEPTFNVLKQLYEDADMMSGELFLAVGGGSVLDTAKLLAVMAGNPEFASDIRKADLIHKQGIPFWAVPTTAGTGAEATPNAILFEEKEHKKIGIVSRNMIADTVILDALLTASMPKELAAATGFDALAHAWESFTSKKANAYSDMFATEAMNLIFHNLIPACVEDDEEARQNMLLASFYAGVCLVTSSTHVVHAMAYPLAEQFSVPHGKGIAALLAAGVREQKDFRSIEIIRSCLPKKYRYCKQEELYCIIEEYQKVLDMKIRLREFGVVEGDCRQMADAAKSNKRLFDNCRLDLSEAAVEVIYKSLL